MRRLKDIFVIVIVFALSAAVAAQDSYAWRWPWRRKKTAPRYKRIKPLLRPKKYRYIRSHDLNGDGRVAVKDRLWWLKRHGRPSGIIVIDETNEDIYDAIDYNGDGKVSKTELDKFCFEYDLNRNGTLEESEIDAASD